MILSKIKIYKVLVSFMVSLLAVFMFSTFAFAETADSSEAGHDLEAMMNKTMQMNAVANGDYKVQLISPSQFKEGENEVIVAVTKEDKPVSSLAVNVSAEMEMSGASHSMNHGQENLLEQTLAEGKKGEYSGTLDLKGDGKWILTVQLPNQQTAFEVLVEKGGPNWIVIGGFLIVIIAIIIAAGVKKKRTSGEG